ncbi:hypothetical protein AKJ09_02755 [Labilithrix luteola]|uniref:Transmembrane protein n=1 Tax=Labilithrix luteola TaxID=1391654 RepID=A0A0K1PRS1_9BACT|nr:hypothetical protein [Labilithrix luteola]AKU96091.1 hypothetical protein AKJ09_02755 [Labilithrix luteola]
MDHDSTEVCVEGMSSDTFEVVDEREPRVLLAFVWALSLVPTITTLMFLDDDLTTLVRRFLVEALILIVVAVWVERRSTANDWRERPRTKTRTRAPTFGGQRPARA